MRVLYVSELPGVMDMRFLRSLAPEVELGLASFDYRKPYFEEIFTVPEMRVFQLDSYPRGFTYDSSGSMTARLKNRLSVANARRRMVKGLKRTIDEFQPDIILGTIVQNGGWVAYRSGFHPCMSMPWGSDVIVIPYQNPRLMKETLEVLHDGDTIVTDSPYARRMVGKLDHSLLAKTFEGPYGIDPNLFRPKKTELRKEWGWENDEVVIFCRGFREVYAPEIVKQAFDIAVARRDRLRMVALGDGDWKDDRIRMLPRQSYDRIPELLTAADVFVQANRSDGCPASLLEAMACELPIASTDLPTYHEMMDLSDGVTLVPVDQPKLLADAICSWFEVSPEVRRKAGRHNRKRVRERYDWDKNFPMFLEQLSETIRRSRGEAPALDPEMSPSNTSMTNQME